MDRITEDIYLGNLSDAGRSEWLRDGSPTAVLKLTAGDPAESYPDAVVVREVPLVDGPGNDYADFEAAVGTMLDLLVDHTVFVHCRAGVSRSGAVTAAALAVRRDISVEEAVAFVRERRPMVRPHPHLRDQAERFVEEY
ncbi:MAG: dual specificity protein phosphatase [Halapricum sp.]